MYLMPICEHLRSDSYPLIIDWVFDDAQGFTDCLAHCRVCHQSYLLEMLDWRRNLRLFRVSCTDPGQSERLMRDLEQGSCDLSRAAAESEQFRLANSKVVALLLLDTRTPRIIALVPAEDDIPRHCWRDLPCDGRWIERVQVSVARS